MKLVARSFIFAFATFASISIAYAQSTDQNFPTPVTTTEISGTIRARDYSEVQKRVFQNLPPPPAAAGETFSSARIAEEVLR